MSSADNTGLGLFDDAASAAGSFPTALRGYDRSAVDEYVRSLEAGVVASRRQAGELREELERVHREQAEREADPPEVDYAELGGRASDILRLAQEQARDLTENATAEAERTKELARREADAIRRDAARQGEEIRSGGVAQIDQLRARLHEDVQAQVEHTRSDAEAVVAAAHRQAESLRRQAEHEAQTVRQEAYLDTEDLRRSVEREAAEARQEVAVAREQALEELRTVHEEAQGRTAALLAEATEHHAAATARLEADVAEAARVRAEALAEGEAIRVAAAEEADSRLAAAQQEAAALRERTLQEFSWRKQQLRRETELLSQRKQAVLGQLASLSALAEQTAQTFPDLDELDVDTDDLPRSTEDDRGPGPEDRSGEAAARTDEDGTTVVTAVAQDAPRPGADDDDTAEMERLVDPRAAGRGDDAADDRTAQDPTDDGSGEDRTESAETTGGAQPDDTAPRGMELPPVDGDATILISAADLPAGTEHLQRRSEGSEQS